MVVDMCSLLLAVDWLEPANHNFDKPYKCILKNQAYSVDSLPSAQVFSSGFEETIVHLSTFTDLGSVFGVEIKQNYFHLYFLSIRPVL